MLLIAQHIPETPILVVIVTTLCATWFIIGYLAGRLNERKRYERIDKLAEDIIGAIIGKKET